MSVTDSGVTAATVAGEHPDLDAAIGALQTGAQQWAALPPLDRAHLIRAVQRAVGYVAREWVATAAAAKGLASSSPLVGEEWTSGPYALAEGARALARSLTAIGNGGSPLDGLRFGSAPGDRTTVKIMPADLLEWTLFNGHSAEVWLRPGITASRAKAEAGLGSRRVREPGVAAEHGGVGLVLGAGNISSIAPLDALYELVAHNRASIIKLNPTFATLQWVYESVLAPLIEFGVVRVVQGGAAIGGYLAHHPGIEHVHITGSSITHDAIVWGPGVDGDRRRASDEPLLTVPITSELGGVSPIIVVPGEWTAEDLRFQAEHVATMRLHNAGHNCIAGQSLVISADWAQKDDFLDAVRTAFDRIPARETWYPGSADRIARAGANHRRVETHNGRLIIDVPADQPDDLRSFEYFAPVLGVTELPGLGAAFLDNAVAFANEKLAGTLGANVIVAPADRKAMGTAWGTAIERLHYGCIAINSWTGVGFLLADASWGAYPGHTLDAVGSGIGIVHNGRLIDGVERTVVTGPFRPFPRSLAMGEFSLFPKPPWWVTAKTAAAVGEKLTAFAVDPSWLKLPGIFVDAFRG